MYQILLRYIFIILCGVLASALGAQATINPFELSPRLSAAAAPQPTTPATPADSLAAEPDTAVYANPFELRQPAEAATSVAATPIKPQTKSAARRQATLLAEKNTAWLLGLVVGSLLLTALSITFFRGLYTKCYRAALSDNLLSQLYREREGSGLLPFALIYVVFLLCSGLFAYQLNLHWNQVAAGPIQQQTFVLSGLIFGVFFIKHLVLSILGYVFPIAKETKLYSFSIMIFAILAGLILAPVNLLLAYSPLTWREPVIYGTLGLIGLLYLLRIVRGIEIANRFIFLHQLHFLLYICAIEIVPVLFLYKLAQGSLL